MWTIPRSDPLAVNVVKAITDGDTVALEALLREHPELVATQIGEPECGNTRSLLHIATDWPGHRPNGAAIVAVLAAAGVDVNARGSGRVAETPLHWAASSDDVAVLDALLDAGANIEVDDAAFANGTPLEDAITFGQWNAARRLVERGAAVTFRQAAALGLMDAVAEGAARANADDLSMAFWYACHGGEGEAATYLLNRGADVNWIAPWDSCTPLDAATRSRADSLVRWLRERGARTRAEVDL